MLIAGGTLGDENQSQAYLSDKLTVLLGNEGVPRNTVAAIDIINIDTLAIINAGDPQVLTVLHFLEPHVRVHVL